MSTKDNITKLEKNQYHHLKYEDRVKIEFMLNQKNEDGARIYNNTQIANELGVHKSTITRELKRIKSKISVMTGKIKNKPYNAHDASEDYKFRRALSKAHYILDQYPKMRKYIENKIKVDGWAPDVIVGYMNKNEMYLKDGFTSISVPTIYNAIRYGIIDVKPEDTRRMVKFQKSHKDLVKKELPENKKQYSIENRPDNINNREEFGHFELDTVIGTNKGIRQCLLTLTERKTRFEMIFKIETKTAEKVVEKFNQIKTFLAQNYDKLLKSITTDNGVEFSDFLNIIKDTDTKIYFCHPYASCEKGTNERHNGLIRYFVPKGDLIENYSSKDINDICAWMNNYPRKILDYRTPLEALQEEVKDKSLIKLFTNVQVMVNTL